MTKQPVPGLHENFAEEAAMTTDKAMVTDANLRSIIHNALIDGPRLEDDTTAAFNGLVELLHDRISAALAQAEQPVAWLKRKSKKPLEPIEYETCEPGRVASFPVYAHPPAKREAGETAPAPVQHLEPVAWRFRWVYPATGEPTAWAETHDPRVARQKEADGWDVRPLYEHPPAPQTRGRVSDTPSAALEASHE